MAFARAEPGLFRVAFAGISPPDPEDRSAHGVLADALDDLVATGALPAARRRGAEAAAWAAVHGIATLLLDEALCPPDVDPEPIIERTLRMVVSGL